MLFWIRMSMQSTTEQMAIEKQIEKKIRKKKEKQIELGDWD